MIFDQHKPIFRQIADHVCDEIMLGRYAIGARIPSVREYAVALEVNVNTVARSFEMLQNDGIIVKDRGIGFFVADKALEVIRRQRIDRFNDEYLPDLFRQMHILGISGEEIARRYDKYLASLAASADDDEK